jgi:magnesium-dependent phosphatase 1
VEQPLLTHNAMLVRSHVRLALLGSLLSLTSVSAFITPAIPCVSVKSMRSAVASQPKISMKKGSASMAAELPVAELPRGAERPKLVVFDLDNTMWTPELYQLKRSPKAGRDIYLFPGTIAALHELATLAEWKGTAVAFASRTNKVAWAEDLITRFEVADSVTMASLAKYKEIYPGSKRKHFEKLKADSGIPFSDMIFFDVPAPPLPPSFFISCSHTLHLSATGPAR